MNRLKVCTTSVALTLLLLLTGCIDDKPILKTNEFSWYPNRIEQQDFTAVALSETNIMSNYQSPLSSAPDKLIEFKFAINGADCEMRSGINHKYLCDSQQSETPVIRFGEQLDMSGSKADTEPMAENTGLTVRVDLNEVFNAFETTGFFTTKTGYKIYKEDFKGVWIAGGVPPMIWDFDNIAGKDFLRMSDPDGDNIYEIALTLNVPEKRTDRQWVLTNDISSYPQYSAPTLLEEAIYNMAVDEMVNAVEPDNTLRTGKEWAGVWTRDVSYSIILSMAYMQPEVAKNSLLRKVNSRMRIIQDTGTGGAWPCSTDRMIWAVAAWELYLVTGDTDWLRFAYPIICNSIDDDRLIAYNAEYGLMMGESSFIDWRDQSYPKWMQPVDIYKSMCLGTNAVHYQSLNVASDMARILNDSVNEQKYSSWADSIRLNINKHLYNHDTKYYSTYLYGRNSCQREDRSESLGEALAILWDIAPAELQPVVSRNMPFTPYGAPIFYPYIDNVPPYHNNGVWPFVSSYVAMAYAKTRNMDGILHSLATVYRAAALFCTNKENFEASNGDYKSMQVNSDNMLWSLSGNIGMTHKILLGLSFAEDGLHFSPVVPKELAGCRTLSNFKCRNATLDIEVSGHGSEIMSFSIDGNESADFFVPLDIKGEHTIKIELKPSGNDLHKINLVRNFALPHTPNTSFVNDTLSWAAIDNDIKEYIVYLNGVESGRIAARGDEPTYSTVVDPQFQGEIQVRAYNRKTGYSFASEPIRKYDTEIAIEVENYTAISSFAASGFNGKGFALVDNNHHNSIDIVVDIPQSGTYVLDLRYANGNGPTNTDNKCAIRSVSVDNSYIGSFVMPQRGTDEWSNWGWSNSIPHHFDEGKHTIKLYYAGHNFNMNMKVNSALVDQLRLTKL